MISYSGFVFPWSCDPGLVKYDPAFIHLSILIAQLVKNPPAVQETLVQFLDWEDLLEKATHSTILGLWCGSAGKESTCNVGDLGLIPGLRRCPGEGKGYPLQNSGLENSMDYIVHGVAKSQKRLTFTFPFTSVYPSTHLPTNPFLYPPSCFSVPSSIHLSNQPFPHPSGHLSIYPFIQ